MTEIKKRSAITIEYVNSSADAVFTSADWSIVNVPDSTTQVNTLSKNLFNTPGNDHLALVLCRHARKKRNSSLRNMTEFGNAGWSYLDTINITYQKPNSGSNNGLLPMGEIGLLYYKGEIPNTKATAWFGEPHANATNVWDLGSQEGDPNPAICQKFNWELQLLMKSMSNPLEHRVFVYAADITVDEIPSLQLFCKEYEMSCKLYVTDKPEYHKIIDFLNKSEKK